MYRKLKQILIHEKFTDNFRLFTLNIHASDSFFCDMVRSNRHAEITLIDRALDVVCRHLCNTLQLSPNRYTTQTVQGHPARKYDNRIIVVQADLSDIDLTPWLEDPDNKSLKNV